MGGLGVGGGEVATMLMALLVTVAPEPLVAWNWIESDSCDRYRHQYRVHAGRGGGGERAPRKGGPVEQDVAVRGYRM